jgi:iron complex outermembrane receptor protein
MRHLLTNLRAGIAAVALVPFLAAAAHAQTAPQGTGQSADQLPTTPATAAASDAADVVVTGSRIRRDPLDQPSPVVTLDDSAIARTGLSSIADVLERLPSSAGGLNTKFNNSGNLGNPPDGGGGGAGSASIDLRYLGIKLTLVLVDGLPYVNGASASGIPGRSTSTRSPPT